jgi:hypothetical protein
MCRLHQDRPDYLLHSGWPTGSSIGWRRTRWPQLSVEGTESGGEIPPARDLDLVPGTVIGFNILHKLLGWRVDRDYVRRILTIITYLPITASIDQQSSGTQGADWSP